MSQYVYLIAPIAAWSVSQMIKIALRRLGHKRLHLSDVVSSGRMPSSHVAGPMALLAVIATREGVSDPVFALGAVFALLVAYDAVGVRRTAAESATAVKNLSSKLGMKAYPEHIFKGHTLPEVVVGGLVGIGVGLVVSAIF